MDKYEYVLSGDKYPDDAYEFESEWNEDYPARLTEDAAKDYYDNHDGWGSEWPVDLEIYINGKILSVFNVSLEYEPIFYAIKKEDNEGIK
ncbi:hypothetical protein [Photorhabdus sp. SF281]|uniref:hypothetical protein n=1 Tax=Photorhabdus sp. SF281 TaxID=3459527 RepID=UPI0040450DAB